MRVGVPQMLKDRTRDARRPLRSMYLVVEVQCVGRLATSAPGRVIGRSTRGAPRAATDRIPMAVTVVCQTALASI